MKIDNNLLRFLSSYKLSGKEFEMLIAIGNGISLKVDLENFLDMSRQNTHKYIKSLLTKGLIRQAGTILRSPYYELSLDKDTILGQEVIFDTRTFNQILINTKKA